MPWIIESISLTEDARKYGRNAHYRYHVRGLNTEHPIPERFSWTVPDVDDPTFDKSRVMIPDKGLCPICGESISLNGETKDGRLIGTCGDAFTSARWEEP